MADRDAQHFPPHRRRRAKAVASATARRRWIRPFSARTPAAPIKDGFPPVQLIRSPTVARDDKRTVPAARTLKMHSLLKPLAILALASYALCEIPCPNKCLCDRNSVECIQRGLLAVPKTPTDTHTLCIIRIEESVRSPRIYVSHISDLQLLRGLLSRETWNDERRERFPFALGALTRGVWLMESAVDQDLERKNHIEDEKPSFRKHEAGIDVTSPHRFRRFVTDLRNVAACLSYIATQSDYNNDYI
ncbi:unnamed protein product, partial [Iphiclides podalirius]